MAVNRCETSGKPVSNLLCALLDIFALVVYHWMFKGVTNTFIYLTRRI